MNWTEIIIGALGIFAGAGFWGVIKSIVDKKKTPYDMLKELLLETKKFYEERNAEYERERTDSMEKSVVIAKSQFCQHKYTNPDIVCPVDKANIERLQHRCDRCEYHQEQNENEDN